MTQLLKNKIQTMFDMQEQFNIKVDENWRNKSFNFKDAIWTEAAEAFNHTEWEWWKKEGAVPDVGQIKMELVDIWHFLMSLIMLNPPPVSDCWIEDILIINESVLTSFTKIREEFAGNIATDIEVQRRTLKNLIAHTISGESIDGNDVVVIVADFLICLRAFKMDWDELYKLYIGKNTLNEFRRNNGYKTDTAGYKAVWAKMGIEDNEFLTVTLGGLDVNSPTFKQDIYEELECEFNDLDGK